MHDATEQQHYELAVVLAGVPPLPESTYWLRQADALITSPVLAQMKREWQAEARAEGDGAIHDAYALAYDRGHTEALLEAARYFEYEMAPAWGGEARWISTGGHVADLVGCILRERAAELAETTDTEETP